MYDFLFGVDSLANVNSNIEDPLSEEMVALIKKMLTGCIRFGEKCSNRSEKKTEEYEVREWTTLI